MTTAPAFRQIPAPLDVPDDALNKINRHLGVPTLVQPDEQPRAIEAAPVKAVNVHLPDYVVKALKEKAFQANSSVRYVIMKALADSGITIANDDLVQDARRTNQSRSS